MIVTLIFMDESGDTGFNFQFGSSRYFVVVMVIFDSASEAERVIAALDALREELRLPAMYEFRFSTGAKTRYKQEFLKALLPFSFRYRAMLVDKHEFAKSVGDNPEDKLLSVVVAALFSLGGGIRDAVLYVDQLGEQEFARRFNVAVRKQLRVKHSVPIVKIKHVDSRRHSLLQVADMICGAIYRAHTRGENEFWRLIQSKAEHFVRWQKEYGTNSK